MHDLFFVGFLAALFVAGLYRPFLLILLYVYIDVIQPQRLTYWLINSVPISLIAVVAAFLGWLLTGKEGTRVAPRQILIVVLLGYCGLTTLNATIPAEAIGKWEWVWKALAFAAFLPLTLRTRLRIEALLLFMILSAGTIIITGGIKTALGGGGYGSLDLMINDNSGIYEGSTISTVAIAIIPIVFWLARWGTIFPPDWRARGFSFALAFACLLIPIGTATRTGLLCIALLAVLMLRTVKRRLLYLGALALVGLAAVPFLPSTFTQRMDTMKSYQADESAATRLAVWRWTIDLAAQHPFGAGFEAYRGNKLRYELQGASGAARAAAPGLSANNRVTVDQGRAWHSAYFEMLGEQGYPGLALWLMLQLGGIIRMEIVRRRYRSPDGPFAWGGALAGALQSAHLVYLLGAAFVTIASLPFFYMLMGVEIGLDTYLARKRREIAAPTGWTRADTRSERSPAFAHS